MSKVLVAGGTGYIGSHTIVNLIEQGYEIVCVDNFSNSYSSVIGKIKIITKKEISHYTLDLTDEGALDRVFEEHPDIDSIIHFAAYLEVEDSVKHPLKYYENNVLSTIRLLQAARDYGVSQFVFSSSCTVYGDNAPMPVSEDAAMGRPSSPYGATKQMCEQILMDAVQSGDLGGGVILRYFNTAGAHPSGLIGENPRHPHTHLIPIISQVARGDRDYLNVYGTDYETRDGSCIRDYIHVMDLATAHVKSLNFALSPDNKGIHVFNIGTGKGVSVLEATAAFEKATGIEIKTRGAARRPGDMPAIYANPAKANRILGWTAEFSLEDIMLSAWRFNSTEQGQ